MANARVEHEVKLWVLLLLISLCLFQFFWQLGERPFYSRGESREGLVVQEIFTGGNWILPRVNGDYIPFKPPLFHWIGTLAAIVTGTVNEFSVRFPSALFATLGVLLTYWAGARLWSEPTGRYGAFILATNAAWWRAGTLAQVDMTLAFFVAATLLCFYYMHERDACGPWHSVVLALLWACATLSKGPLGCLLPLLVVLLYLALRRDLGFLKKLHILLGAITFVVVVGGWYGLAILQGGWAFLIAPNHRGEPWHGKRRLGPLSTLSLFCAGIFLQPRSLEFLRLVHRHLSVQPARAIVSQRGIISVGLVCHHVCVFFC